MATPKSFGFEQEERGSQSRPRFRDVARLKSADGVVSIISERVSTGKLTFGMFREFERDGVVERTSFFPEDMTQKVMDHLQLTLAELDKLRARRDGAPAGRARS